MNRKFEKKAEYNTLSCYDESVFFSYVMRTKLLKQAEERIESEKKIYVASKYAGDVGKNIVDAIEYCRYVIEQGYMPLASHLMYPLILDDDNPKERELGLSYGLVLLAMCDEVWVFGKISAGMLGEIEEARRLGKTIRFISEVE